MRFCNFESFGPHGAPMQNLTVFDGLATWSDPQMVTLDAFFRVQFWVPFLHAFGGAFGDPLGSIWEAFWGPWDPFGHMETPWPLLGTPWGLHTTTFEIVCCHKIELAYSLAASAKAQVAIHLFEGWCLRLGTMMLVCVMVNVFGTFLLMLSALSWAWLLVGGLPPTAAPTCWLCLHYMTRAISGPAARFFFGSVRSDLRWSKRCNTLLVVLHSTSPNSGLTCVGKAVRL